MLAIISMITSNAQEGYRINGKANGMADGTLLLMSDENGKTDTLGTTQIQNGIFVFTGKVNAPVMAYIVSTTGNGIPLILENANFMININSAGVLIQGGKQQELFTRYMRVTQAFSVEQTKVAAEARQPGANIQALQKRVDKAYESSVNATLDLSRRTLTNMPRRI